jgi:hypothetical protein
VSVSTPTRKAGVAGVAVRRQPWLFVILSIMMFAVVLIAFAPTLYLRTTLPGTDTLLGNVRIPNYLIVHGVILTTWFVLFVIQNWLVASRNIGLHKRLGVLAAVIAAAVVTSSAYTVARVTPRAIAVGHKLGTAGDQTEPILRQYFVPIVVADLMALVVFTLFVCAALYWRRRPATHKRLMLLASVMILGPAFSPGRLVGRTLAMIMPETWPWRVFVVVCIGALLWHDRATRGRIEPATVWGSVTLVGAVLLVGIIIESSGAAVIAHWLATRSY